MFLYIYKVNSQAIAGKAGACDALINMMNSHIGNSSLCEQGCSSLQIITADRKYTRILK